MLKEFCKLTKYRKRITKLWNCFITKLLYYEWKCNKRGSMEVCIMNNEMNLWGLLFLQGINMWLDHKAVDSLKEHFKIQIWDFKISLEERERTVYNHLFLFWDTVYEAKHLAFEYQSVLSPLLLKAAFHSMYELFYYYIYHLYYRLNTFYWFNFVWVLLAHLY